MTDGYFDTRTEGCGCQVPHTEWLGPDRTGWRCEHGNAWRLVSRGEFPRGYWVWQRAPEFDHGWSGR